MDLYAELASVWRKLASELGILDSEASQFPAGDEVSSILDWLGKNERIDNQTPRLARALERIGRGDIVDTVEFCELPLLMSGPFSVPISGRGDGFAFEASNQNAPGATEELPNANLLIDPGTASAEEIAEFLAELSKLYRMMGGSGIRFTKAESRCAEGEIA